MDCWPQKTFSATVDIDVCVFDIEWIGIKFGGHIHVSLRTSWTNFGDPSTLQRHQVPGLWPNSKYHANTLIKDGVNGEHYIC